MGLFAFSTEMQIIMAASHSQPQQVDLHRISGLAARLDDWTRFTELVTLHRVGPLLANSLRTAGCIPSPVKLWLQQQLSVNSVRNVRLASSLLRVLKLFEEAGIESVPFKGPTLTNQAYGNLGLRVFGDVDLLVKRQNMERAAALLWERGFETPDHEKNPEHIPAQLGLNFYHPDGLIVEMHWALVQRWLGYRYDPHEIWQRMRKQPFCGQSILSLPSSDLLLYLCAHGVKHHWSNLFWIVDIAEVLRTEPALDWNLLYAQAKERGSVRVLNLGLLLARQLLGAPVPPEVVARLTKDTQAEALAIRICSWLSGARKPPEAGSKEEDKFFMQSKEHWSAKAIYAWHIYRLAWQPSPADRAFVRLPRALEPVYYLVRPIRILSQRIHRAVFRK